MKKIPPLVQIDPWLEPNAADLHQRTERFLHRLKTIESDFGSLGEFANAWQYYGINYDHDRKGWVYREWAPAARELYLFGDFNGWRRFSHPMSRNDYGVWEIFLDERTYANTFVHGSLIKVLVVSEDHIRERIPAYIRRVVQNDESKDFTAQVWLPRAFDWQGDVTPLPSGPLFIYESHVGMATEEEGVGTYLEFTETVLPRIKALGYNAIQLMAIQEHPYYGSFGYHVSSFFAPSSRFGTPEDLKTLIRAAHREGIAVIMDLVHSHTVKNILEGINEFDGTDYQYFHPGPRGEHPDWDSKLFDYGKTEVIRFLLSNISYWMKEFHFDGFRFDGVGSMMYYHHGNSAMDDRNKFFTDGVEYDAITYLQLANTLVHSVNPDAITIAEDVTGMPGLCYPVEGDGIGFDYRLGMGLPDFWIRMLKDLQDEQWNIHELWQVMNDRLPYVKTVAYCESHDQALVGDKTIAFRLMDKEMYDHMQVNDRNIIIDRGLALHKMIRLFTLSLGGQAWLNFMGNEFGHPEWIDFPREGNNWSYYYARRQWSLADNPRLKYQYLLRFEQEMISLASGYHLLSEDFGVQLNMDEENKTIVFTKSGLVFVFNFHPTNAIPNYRFLVPEPGTYLLSLNSDSAWFGGHHRIDENLEYFSQVDEKNNTHYLSIYNTNRTVQVFRKVSG
ncbi:MAG TPA: alpha-amylase family glycosyl hydrolase [Bacteroidales bacterium]|nr:alpha-amylase family glycosyl hydrolase [Bacteroidales bacterium]HSA42644.1 alpha-amylase family glycosyl hydrolase [Bacteroidales bacterium]